MRLREIHSEIIRIKRNSTLKAEYWKMMKLKGSLTVEFPDVGNE
jgi:hypothetical protein